MIVGGLSCFILTTATAAQAAQSVEIESTLMDDAGSNICVYTSQWIMWPRSINCVNDPMPCCECVHRTLIYSAILACNFNWIDHKSPQARLLSFELNSQWTCSEWRSDEKTMYKPPNQIISSAFDAFLHAKCINSKWVNEWMGKRNRRSINKAPLIVSCVDQPPKKRILSRKAYNGGCQFCQLMLLLKRTATVIADTYVWVECKKYLASSISINSAPLSL